MAYPPIAGKSRRMKTGLVTNCWQKLLESGEPLPDLVSQAADRGYQAIELRQGSLGKCETAAGVAIAAELAQLSKPHDGIEFDYAMAFPFLSSTADYQSPALAQGLEAALATAGQTGAHMRLVDIETSGVTINDLPAVSPLVEFAGHCQDRGIRLSLEHSRQPWDMFWAMVSQARSQLGTQARPCICFDPANFCLVNEQSLPLELLARLSLEEISMVHLKQYSAGKFLDVLSDGEVDWTGHYRILQERSYNGPIHLEIMATTMIWQQLEASWSYWSGLAANC